MKQAIVPTNDAIDRLVAMFREGTAMSNREPDFVDKELDALKARGYPVQPIACPWCLSRGLACRHPCEPDGSFELHVYIEPRR